MENQEKIIQKIGNLLAMAGNDPGMQEAAAAVLKVQELMAEYHMEYGDIRDGGNTQEILKIAHTLQRGHHNNCKWRCLLAEIIAGNFCCRTYRSGRSVVFYGYEKDAQAAAEVFRFLYETGNRLASRYYRKCKREGRPTKGAQNAYLHGFSRRIQEVLEEQGSALMAVLPKEVEEAWKGMEGEFCWKENSLRIGGTAAGKKDRNNR